jgi:hypothetical protein
MQNDTKIMKIDTKIMKIDTKIDTWHQNDTIRRKKKQRIGVEKGAIDYITGYNFEIKSRRGS